MASKYKLYYFNTMTLAEPIRLIFAYANEEYDDIRIERTNWPNHKKVIPWGKLPALELPDGQFLCQSSAIIRYLSKKFDLIGESDLEAAKCDEYAGTVADLQQEFAKIFKAPNDEAKMQIKVRILETVFPKYCDNFISIIKENGTGYLVGRKLSYADLVLSYGIGQLCKLVDPKLLNKFPEMETYIEFVNDHPGIKEWIATRPPTPI